MQFQPFIYYHETSLIINSLLASGHHQPSLFIGLIQLKEQQACALLSQSINLNNESAISWISKPFSITSSRKGYYIYMPINRQKSEEKYEEFIAKIIMNMCHCLVFDINSKFIRSSSNYSLTKNTKKKNFMTLSNGKGQVYEIDLQTSQNKIELSQKILQDQFAKEIVTISDNNQFSQLNCLSNLVTLINKLFSSVVSWKSIQKFQFLWQTLLIQCQIIQSLNITFPSYKKLINDKQMQPYPEIQQIITYINNFKVKLQGIQQICLRVKRNMIYDIQTLNQSLMFNYIQNIRNIKLEDGNYNFEYKNKDQLVKNYGLPQFMIEMLNNEYEGEILKIKYDEIQREFQKQKQANELLKAQLLIKNNIINDLKYKIEQNNEQIMQFQQMKTSFELIKESLSEENNKNNLLLGEVKCLRIQLVKMNEKNNNLQRFINNLIHEKSILNQEIQKQGIAIHNLKIQKEQLIKKIEEFQRYRGQIERIQLIAQFSIEKCKLSDEKVQKMKQFKELFEENLKSYKKIQKDKFNYILKRNYMHFQEIWKCNNQLKLQINNLNLQKTKLIGEIEHQKQKNIFFEKEVLKIINKNNYQFNNNHLQYEDHQCKQIFSQF